MDELVSQDPKVKEDKEKKLIIDSLMEVITKNLTDKNDNIQLQIIKLILTIVINPNYPLHAHSLVLGLRTILHLYSCIFFF